MKYSHLPGHFGTLTSRSVFRSAVVTDFRLYSETKLTLILDSNSSKYRSSVVGVGLTRV